MIVPAMNLEELRREVFKDLEIVMRKAHYTAQKVYQAYKPLREKEITLFFDYLSKYKNRWMYRIVMNKRETLYEYITYFHGRRGFSAIIPIQDKNRQSLVYFTDHFFKRYNERGRFNLPGIKEVIKAFMSRNVEIQNKRIEEFAPGKWELFSVTGQGVMLGTADDNAGIYKMNTFLTKDMLHPNQEQMFKEMQVHLNKYRDDTQVIE